MMVSIQYAHQMDTGSGTEETWERTEIEAECRYMKLRWVKAKSFYLKMYVQQRVMSIVSYVGIKAFWGRKLELIL